jgi:hypothetical protein
LKFLRIKNLTNSKIYDIIIIESEGEKMGRTDYLVYGTHVDTPWDETLLCIVDSVGKAEYAMKSFEDSGEWTKVRYEGWKVQ